MLRKIQDGVRANLPTGNRRYAGNTQLVCSLGTVAPGSKATIIAYEPVPEWATGMGYVAWHVETRIKNEGSIGCNPC